MESREIVFFVPPEHFSEWQKAMSFGEKCQKWIHSLIAGGRYTEELRKGYEDICKDHAVLEQGLRDLQRLASPKPVNRQSGLERSQEGDKRLVYMLVYAASQNNMIQVLKFYQSVLAKEGAV
ncbi:MAG: hypothetical protein WC794_02135 [Candidatus Doudnabacteria bacterium]|jgi:hypothetical protein